LNEFKGMVEGKIGEYEVERRSNIETKIDSNTMKELIETYSEKLISRVELIMKNKK
jgi:hypothetical protein